MELNFTQKNVTTTLKVMDKYRKFQGYRLILDYGLPTEKDDWENQKNIESQLISAILARFGKLIVWYAWRYKTQSKIRIGVYVHYRTKRMVYQGTYGFLGLIPQIIKIRDSERYFQELKNVETENIGYDKKLFTYVKEQPKSRIRRRLRELLYNQHNIKYRFESVNSHYEPDKCCVRKPVIDPAGMRQAWKQGWERDEEEWAQKWAQAKDKIHQYQKPFLDIQKFIRITYGVLGVILGLVGLRGLINKVL